MAKSASEWRWFSMAIALTSITVSVLPVFLFGALASFIRDELPLSHTALGVTAAGFYCTSALASVHAGRLGHRVGPERTMALGGLVSIVSMLGVAILSSSWWVVLLFLCLGGVGNAVAQPGANAIVARDQPVHLLGTSFGILQTAVPLSTLLAGSAVPVVAGFTSWRWAFVVGALLAAPVVVWGAPRAGSARPPSTRHRRGRASPGKASLYVLAAAGGCAAAGGNILGAFYVESIVNRGFPVSTAGLLLVLGSLCGITGRLLWGWLADRWISDPLTFMVVLLLVGIAGFLAIALTTATAALLAGTLLAFGAGWAWKGLYNLAVVRGNPAFVSVALGISQMGVFAGSVAGPFGFGVLLQHASYEVAWTVTAVVMAAAAALTVAARWLRDERAQV
jgi:MFS family permease